MFIKKIVEVDKTSGEIEAFISSGENELLCYSYALEPKEGLEVKEISSLFAENIMRLEDSQEYLIRKTDNNFSYYLCGKVVDTQKPIVEVDGLRITLDKPLPKDIQQGEFVEFCVTRLDFFL